MGDFLATDGLLHFRLGIEPRPLPTEACLGWLEAMVADDSLDFPVEAVRQLAPADEVAEDFVTGEVLIDGDVASLGEDDLEPDHHLPGRFGFREWADGWDDAEDGIVGDTAEVHEETPESEDGWEEGSEFTLPLEGEAAHGGRILHEAGGEGVVLPDCI